MSEKVIKLSLFYSCFYSFWGFLFTHTTIFPQNSVYPAFILMGVLFVYSYMKSRTNLIIQNDGQIWMPFLLYTFLSFLAISNLENVTYRLVCILLLLLALKCNLCVLIPKRFIFFTGIITMVGIFVQMTMPGFYAIHISSMFAGYRSIVEHWAETGYGFVGFNYQLSHTANSLIIAEGVFVYFFYDMFPACKTKAWIYWILMALFIVCLFLTGKRLFSLLSFGLPLMVYVLSKKQSSKTIYLTLFMSIIGYVAVSYFISNSSSFENSMLFHRFSQTVNDVQTGDNWSSDRELLADQAIDFFHSNPILGIGVNSFHKLSSEKTDVHNSYLQVLCEQGILGFVLFIIPLIICINKTIRRLKVEKREMTIKYLKFSLFVQLYFILYAFTGNVTVDFGNFFHYFLSIAILANTRLQNKACI